MTSRNYLLLFVLGFTVTFFVSIFQNSPGYMDADYYYMGGLRLKEGKGFTEDILWNYLDNPSGLPHPSHAYWMPLASIVALLGMVSTGFSEFWAAKLGFLVIAGLVSPLSARLAYAITQKKRHAILSGILAAIPGFYLSYLGTTDTFGLYMLLGALWFLGIGLVLNTIPSPRPRLFYLFWVGIISGLFHLTRADGLMWCVLGLGVIVWQGLLKTHIDQSIGSTLRIAAISKSALCLLAGYLIVMGPWVARNQEHFQVPFSPGGDKALWLTEYDDLYSYPPEILTPERWLASGWTSIFRARLDALSQNLQSAFAVQGEIFLAPLIVLGLWRLRADGRIRVGLLAWGLTLGVMTVIFPFAGWRGGFFHSGAAYQPLFWAIVPSGLDALVDWGKRVRHWNPGQAGGFFSMGLVLLSILLSTLVTQKRVVGISFPPSAWDTSWREYRAIDQALYLEGIEPTASVLVNNAPGYYVANHRPALSVPNGDLSTALQVARRYGVNYLLLEVNHPKGLDSLYYSPGDNSGIDFLFEFEGTQVYRLILP
jgi:hypothetical protein